MIEEVVCAKHQEEQFQSRLEERLFSGTPLKYVEQSLYISGDELFSILYGSTSAYSYFFRFVPSQLSNTQAVIFVCGNDTCAFKIPARLLMNFTLGMEDDKRVKTTITYEELSQNWILTFYKDEPNQIQILIDPFHHDLRLVEETQALAVALKKLLL